MLKRITSSVISLLCLSLVDIGRAEDGAQPRPPAHLPGELSADQVLNGEYPFPPSPAVEVKHDATGLAKNRLSAVPPPGVHPRVLLSPDDLPDLRRRITETAPGRAMIATLRSRTGGSILKAGAWEADVYDNLAAGDIASADRILAGNPKPSTPAGHYQPHIPYAIVMEAFDAMVSEDDARGRKVAAAIAGWAELVEPGVDASLAAPLHDDVWRVKLSGPATGSWSESQGLRDLLGGHLMGYAYDFAFNYMNDAQRDQVRRVIAKATAGRLWMGGRLPHHFRNWNWIAIGLQQPLLALAIEGEAGYDPRVYRLGAQIARDYLTYGISTAGSSTEAVGYTQFGFVWGAPFFAAAARRGEDSLLTHGHHRAMLDWYLHSMEPYGARWQSHGDGGDGGPAIWTMSMWRHFFPDDPRAQTLWQQMSRAAKDRPYDGRFHIIEPLIWCAPEPDTNHGVGEKLGLPLAFHDAERGSLNARTGWSADAAAVQFECRVDSHGASHEHSDRGNFTFSALGRAWSRENFRSIETRHHSNVLIDGQGQGYWPGPGVWIGHVDEGWAITAACDAKEAYAWAWPKAILADEPASPRFQFERWTSYAKEAEAYQRDYAGVPITRDDRPAVVKFWQGFDSVGGGPRLWDEDGWPVRVPHNPVQRAFRTIAFVREPVPYLIVVDDIQKDDQPRLYEWLMQTGPDTDMASLKTDEIVLCDASAPRNGDGLPRPKKGERQLLVRSLDRATASGVAAFQATPSIRLETFERKDTNTRDGRSFSLDRRLVIPSRAASPDFKVILVPHRAGDAVPEIVWDAQAQRATVTVDGVTDRWTFTRSDDGRTRVIGEREGKSIGPIQTKAR